MCDNMSSYRCKCSLNDIIVIHNRKCLPAISSRWVTSPCWAIQSLMTILSYQVRPPHTKSIYMSSPVGG
ncbi:hypothetical protein FR483_n190R [Paramecium bursaria Chlorella virus FR483]|uniref:Uncharacterized protein n190R n=1 Tax=Paramecium bursaria Chlorella virus FR483 TaxID=399781 RepID=A7J6P4_PBCVF|nr:hypothetical protein FR483_n190R [Paramecium bursaria Chlorella virus FR483]ABT15475.1 hypothetical protein FR483_n190R [Paramecium bursaria Chlorella virus FR483]